MALQSDDDIRRRSTVSGERPLNLVQPASHLDTVAEIKTENHNEDQPMINGADNDDEPPPLLERERELGAPSPEHQPEAGDNASESTLVGDATEIAEPVEVNGGKSSPRKVVFAVAHMRSHRRIIV